MKILKFLSFFLITILPIFAQAQEPQVIQKGFTPETVRPHDSAKYVIEFRNIGAKVNLEKMPVPEGLNLVGTNTSRRFNMTNSGTESSTSFILSFMAQTEGVYTIPDWTLTINGKDYPIKSATIKVDKNAPEQLEEDPMAGMPSIFGRRRTQPERKITVDDKVFWDVNLPYKELYIGQTMPCKFVLSYDKSLDEAGVSLADISPEPKDLDSFKFSGFDKNPNIDSTKPDKIYITLNSVITPIKEGVYDIAMDVKGVFTKRASIDDMFNDPFSAMHTQIPFTKKMPETKISVLPLPKENMPDTFTGGIGEFSIKSCVVDQKSVSVDDPITLTLKISGTGNFDRLNPPLIQKNKDWKIYEPTSKFEDESGGKGYMGVKTFEYVIVPTKPDLTDVPNISLTYFDPQSKTYKTSVADQIKVSVAPSKTYQEKKSEKNKGTEIKQEAVSSENIITERKIHFTFDALTESALFMALQVLILLLLTVYIFYAMRKRKLLNDDSYAKKIAAEKALKRFIRSASAAAKKNDVKEFFMSSKAALQAIFSLHIDALPHAITNSEALEYLKKCGKDSDIVDKTSFYFEGADLITYGNSEASNLNLSQLNDELKRLITNLRK